MPKEQLTNHAKLNAVRAVLKLEQSVSQVSKTMGVHRDTIYQWVHQYKKTKSLTRKTNPKSGRQSKILGEDLKVIVKIVKSAAIHYGYDTDFWTTRRLTQVLKKEISLEVSRTSIFRAFKKLKYSYKTPETRYYKADKKKQKEWIFKIVPKIKKLIKKHKAIAYFEDEANISLVPVVAKTWGPIGKIIKKKVSGNRGSISVISAISKDGRLLFNVHDNNKRYNAADIIRFLSQMLIHHPRRHLVVVMDQAPCHKAKLVKEYVAKQKRLHIFYLPARSPEFNPDEKLWFHLKNKELKSHQASNTKDLKKLVTKKLNKIKKKVELTKGIYKRSDGAFF
jgi:transposase